MKPKPFWALNHLTVPVAIIRVLASGRRSAPPPRCRIYPTRATCRRQVCPDGSQESEEHIWSRCKSIRGDFGLEGKPESPVERRRALPPRPPVLCSDLC